MIHAYDELYLEDAMNCLGDAFDYAINNCKVDADDFMALFISTEYAKLFASGNPKYISGMSGVELAVKVFNKAKITVEHTQIKETLECSPEFWSGWILAYYQWFTCRSFKDIHMHISMRDVLKLYGTMHEASEDKFVKTVNSIIEKENEPSNLQRQRKISGLSQKELAEKSGVNLRTLQQYETKAKDINKASINTVLSLSRVLSCTLDDLIEY